MNTKMESTYSSIMQDMEAETIIGSMRKSLKRCDRGNSDVHESSIKEESK